MTTSTGGQQTNTREALGARVGRLGHNARTGERGFLDTKRGLRDVDNDVSWALGVFLFVQMFLVTS